MWTKRYKKVSFPELYAPGHVEGGVLSDVFKGQSRCEESRRSGGLSLDTAVVCGRRILQKAKDEAEARAQMKLLSGRRHRVMTCVALWLPQKDVREDEAVLDPSNTKEKDSLSKSVPTRL